MKSGMSREEEEEEEGAVTRLCACVRVCHRSAVVVADALDIQQFFFFNNKMFPICGQKSEKFALICTKLVAIHA